MALTVEVLLRSTPGTTRATSVRMGERYVITGDVLHHPIKCRIPSHRILGRTSGGNDP
jgi:hypothetical protein